MEFMVLFNERKGDPPPGEATLAEMGRYSGDLRRRGVLRHGGALAPAPTGVGVRVHDGKAVVTDGPFAETKEVIGGFWIIDVADRAEALEIARGCPHAGRGPIEVHVLAHRYTFTGPGTGTPYLFAFGIEPGLRDPDGSKLREMLDFSGAPHPGATIFETAPLGSDPPAARLEIKAGKTHVTDGPFAETKELIGGYALVRASGRAAAIELARRYPHARWGSVEVREVLFFDPA